GPPLSGSANSCQGVNAAGDPVIFFFGGKDADGNENAEVYEYNLTNGETTLRGPMPQPIVNGAKAQLPVVPPSKQQFGNNWLVFGGLSDSIPTNNTYGFTPISPPDTITLVTPMDSVFADSVMMIWNPAEPLQATHYQLQVACDSAMTIFLADTVVIDTSYLVKELSNNTDYWWQVRGYNAGGWGPYNIPIHFLVNFVVSIDDPHQNSTLNLTAAPNPFHDYISISFSLLEPQQVTCALYNIRGEKIDILFSELFPSGINVYDWNIQNLKSGVYFLKLQTQQTKEIQKIIHL
ncbi:MAG TPA: T9SS type A sorting domain-containing protein, partial [Candidatus Cloacimonetes bacterium]|nr:T9SS type A sorting domain-containing protein [Candidatus Cloacimonadota bacterium]